MAIDPQTASYLRSIFGSGSGSGIAAAAQGFDSARNNELMSGLNAETQATADFDGMYGEPDRMMATQNNMLGQSFAYDNQANNYMTDLGTGQNIAQLRNTQSGVNLQQADAANTVAQLRAQLISQKPDATPDEINQYVMQNIPPEQAQNNPYLMNLAYGNQAQGMARRYAIGAALGGNLGANYMNLGAPYIGMPPATYNPTSDSFTLTDQAGNTTTLGRMQLVPAYEAALGNPAGMQQELGNEITNQIKGQQLQNQFILNRGRADYYEGRDENSLKIAQLRNLSAQINAAEHAGNHVLSAQLRQQYNSLLGGDGTTGVSNPVPASNSQIGVSPVNPAGSGPQSPAMPPDLHPAYGGNLAAPVSHPYQPAAASSPPPSQLTAPPGITPLTPAGNGNDVIALGHYLDSLRQQVAQLDAAHPHSWLFYNPAYESQREAMTNRINAIKSYLQAYDLRYGSR